MAQNKRPTESEIQKRVLLARLLLARGFTWPLIQRELKLSAAQISLIKTRIEDENKDFVDKYEVADAYAEFRETIMQAMTESQDVIESSEDLELKLRAIQQKTDLAERVIKVGFESGVWSKPIEEFTMEETKRIQATGRNLAQHIMQRIEDTSEPTRALEPGLEE